MAPDVHAEQELPLDVLGAENDIGRPRGRRIGGGDVALGELGESALGGAKNAPPSAPKRMITPRPHWT